MGFRSEEKWRAGYQRLVGARLVGDLRTVAASASVWVRVGRSTWLGQVGVEIPPLSGPHWKTFLCWEWEGVGVSPPKFYFPRKVIFCSQLGPFYCQFYWKKPSRKKEWGKGKWPCHISWLALREENERGGKARLCVPPPVKHVSGSVHKHGLIRTNQTRPKILEKATDASN